jgi:hypothetical protein
MERQAMTSQQINPSPGPQIADSTASLPSSWGRLLAITTAVVFCISALFPVVAAFVTDRDAWPAWWGLLDVGVAFVLAVLVLAVIGLAQGKVLKQAEDASYRAYRVLIHGIFALLVCSSCLGIASSGVAV